MRIVQLVPRPRLRWLAASAVAATAALAWRAAHRPATPPAMDQVAIICAIPAVNPPDVVAPALVDPHFAIPPPGDPYPRPDLDLRPGFVTSLPAPPAGRFDVEAVLVSLPDGTMPGCGTMLVETTMVFHPLKSTGGGDLRVLVPCAELTRPAYAPGAGDAGVLRVGGRYLLELYPVTDDLSKNAWSYEAAAIWRR